MSAYDVFQNRQTEDAIVVTFRNWTEYVLFDTRKTPFDIPLKFDRMEVETIHIDGDLTIIEV